MSSDSSQQRKNPVSGSDSPPPPILKIQSPIRSSARPVPMTPPRQGHFGKTSGSSSTSNSSSPSHNTNPYQQPPGHHSPDITYGLGSQLLMSSKRRWSNSDEDDNEELMDLDKDYGSEYFLSKDTNSVTIKQEVVTSEDDSSSHAGSDNEEEGKKDFWTTQMMSNLYHHLLTAGANPLDIRNRFLMVGIHQRFCAAIGQPVKMKTIRDHLGTMYNLKKLEQLYRAEIPVEDFTLPAELQQYTH